MATPVDICNLALARIGAEGTLTSLADNTKEGQLCNRHYDQSRKAMLRMYPWRFATKRVVLSPLTTTPAFDFTFEYNLPADCLRLYFVNDTDTVWIVEDNKLRCYDSAVNVKYVADVSNADIFEPLFVESLALFLATKIAFSLTQSGDVQKLMMAEFDTLFPRAKMIQSTEQSVQQLEASLFDRVRIGPNRGFVRDPMT